MLNYHITYMTLIFFSFFVSWESLAQDEVFFKSILNKSLLKSQKIEDRVFHFETYKNAYHYDITKDGQQEMIIPSKKDGIDWIEIKDFQGKSLFSGRLQAYGLESILYKIKIVKLSKDTTALLLFYMDGETNWVSYERSARVYLLTYHEQKFSDKLFKAVHIAIEKEKTRDQYWRRKMSVETADYNRDGVKEIIISYESIQHIFVYSEKNGWKRF